MKQTLNNKYPFELWGLSVLLGTIFLTFILIIYEGNEDELPGLFRLISGTVFLAAIFSWPTFLIVYFTFKKLATTKASLLQIKIILCCVAIAGMLITCFFFGINIFKFDIYTTLPTSYLVSIIISTFVNTIGEIE